VCVEVGYGWWVGGSGWIYVCVCVCVCLTCDGEVAASVVCEGGFDEEELAARGFPREACEGMCVCVCVCVCMY
jgi:hypothetical protein